MNERRKLYQNQLSCGENSRNTKKQDFMKLCKSSSTKRFEDKKSKVFNDFLQSGKNWFVTIY